MFMIDTDQ
jgi:hypothetical protein